MSVIVHIGPPKTATKSLQNSIFPSLGIPFENRPAWTGALARDAIFWMPPRGDDHVIVSDELLGGFGVFSPEQIAARLTSIFAEATILFCARQPLEWFYSLYRQRLITEIELQGRMIRKGLRYEPATPAQFIASQWQEFQRTGTGFFAMTDTVRVQAAFEKHFTFRVLDFSLLQHDPCAFAAAAAAACGAPNPGEISWDNRTDDRKLEQVLALLPPEGPAGLADRYRMFFGMKLAPEYEEFIDSGGRLCPSIPSGLLGGTRAQNR